MAKIVKPLYSLKADFIASLNRYTEEVTALTQAVDIALREGLVDKRVTDIIRRRLDAVEKASFPD